MVTDEEFTKQLKEFTEYDPQEDGPVNPAGGSGAEHPGDDNDNLGDDSLPDLDEFIPKK